MQFDVPDFCYCIEPIALNSVLIGLLIILLKILVALSLQLQLRGTS